MTTDAKTTDTLLRQALSYADSCMLPGDRLSAADMRAEVTARLASIGTAIGLLMAADETAYWVPEALESARAARDSMLGVLDAPSSRWRNNAWASAHGYALRVRADIRRARQALAKEGAAA